DALAWSTWWARATPRADRGVLVAHSDEAARRINAGDAGLDALALTGIAFRALDPEEARIEDLEANGDTYRADMARRARAARVSA
ncbi:MAG TPA: hypothetical protein PKY87_18770, partial [Terricaulis sp.]|nr:hypothetical protein [Terricaulis sp.]